MGAPSHATGSEAGCARAATEFSCTDCSRAVTHLIWTRSTSLRLVIVQRPEGTEGSAGLSASRIQEQACFPISRPNQWTPRALTEIAIVIVSLFSVNGVFLAMSESRCRFLAAVRSEVLCRPGQPKVLATGASAAEDSGAFLSTVQIGSRCRGPVRCVFLSRGRLAARLAGWPRIRGLSVRCHGGMPSGHVGFGLSLAIFYCSLIVGELVPKQIALAVARSRRRHKSRRRDWRSCRVVALPLVWC